MTAHHDPGTSHNTDEATTDRPQPPRGRRHTGGHHRHDPAGSPDDGPGGRGRGHRRGHGRGHGGGRWRQADDPLPADDAADWFAGRLPGEWFSHPPTVTVDREEITVVGELPSEGETPNAATAQGRIARFREETREQRMGIADEAENRYGRKVAWGARLGEEAVIFTNLAVPVMTRLRQPERQVLDTLVDAGVARSRSEALAWAVKQAGRHAETWLAELREAMDAVTALRNQGPDAGRA